MELSLDRTANDTIDLLEARLRRIQYVIFGQETQDSVKDNKRSASMRIRDLEHILDQLVSKSRVMQDLLKLHARHPDFFYSTDPNQNLSLLDVSSKLSIVLSTPSIFPQTASCLTSINDTPLPTAESSTQLINTGAQVAKIEALQKIQMREIATLRQRTAAVLQRWYSVDILQTGEYWADLENRVEHMEQSLRRAALAKQYEENMV